MENTTTTKTIYANKEQMNTLAVRYAKRFISHYEVPLGSYVKSLAITFKLNDVQYLEVLELAYMVINEFGSGYQVQDCKLTNSI